MDEAASEGDGHARLGRATLPRLPAAVRPRHRPPAAIGVVHFGPGAFHRAHQAAYLDRVAEHDPRWGVAAVSMRSRATIDALAEQDGLYTIAIRDAAPACRVIDVHRAFLTADDDDALAALLADPAVALVTATVTEKGYCLAPDGTLDLDHPDIAADLASGASPRSLVGWLVRGLAARRAAGVGPFVAMPCDNLADNGGKLGAALVAFARERDPALADWIAGEVRAPSTMVDSITPASDDQLYADVRAAIGVDDRAAVQREAFTQWVIEDTGVPLGPDLAGAGAIVTGDVAGYERAKLRLLNGAHSTLAYAGLLRGHGSVAAAIGDPVLGRFVEALMRDELQPTLPRVAGFDVDAYRAQLVARFRNPAIVHRLEQIAQDGSQKLPQRLAPPLQAWRHDGVMPRRIVAALGCWIAFAIERARDGGVLADPAAARLRAIADAGDPRAIVERLATEQLGLAGWMAADGDLLAALAGSVDAALARRWDLLLEGHGG